MKLREALIAWNPGTAEIKVGHRKPKVRLACATETVNPGGTYPAWSDAFEMVSGGVEVETASLSQVEAGHRVMSEFIGIVVGDKVQVDAAHREFLKIEEYRAALPADMRGGGA